MNWTSPPIFHGGFAVLGQPQAADCPNALQRGAAGIGGLQLYQGRAQLGAVVAQTLEEPVACHGAAQSGPRQTAAGGNDPAGRGIHPRRLIENHPPAGGKFW